MFKVMLVIVGINGGIIQQVGYENMHECLSDRQVIIEQSKRIDAVCMTTGDYEYQAQQIDLFFEKFIEMVSKFKNHIENEEFHRLN